MTNLVQSGIPPFKILRVIYDQISDNMTNIFSISLIAVGYCIFPDTHLFSGAGTFFGQGGLKIVRSC